MVFPLIPNILKIHGGWMIRLLLLLLLICLLQLKGQLYLVSSDSLEKYFLYIQNKDLRFLVCMRI
jgi:hypothetical protein